jgi:hypothetical protein
MGESIYLAFAVSIVRSALLVAGGWLVSRGLTDDAMMREVAAGLALIVVTQAWVFWRISRRRLYEKWILWLGLDTPPPDDIAQAAEDVRRDARYFTQQGMEP